MKPAPSAPKYASQADPSRGRRPEPTARGRRDERADDEQDDERGGNRHQRQQRAQAVAEEHRASEGRVELVPDLRRVKEERPIVGRRRDVLRVRRVERVAIGRSNQPRVVAGLRPATTSCSTRIRPGAGRVEHVELQARGDGAELVDFAGGERRLLEQERRDVLLPHDRESIGGGPAASLARLLRQRHEPQAVEHPPGDGQDAAVGQMIEVIVERLDGVQRVLRQRVGAGGRGGPRIDERGLNDVVAVRRPPHEAAAVVDRDPHARIACRCRRRTRGSDRA